MPVGLLVALSAIPFVALAQLPQESKPAAPKRTQERLDSARKLSDLIKEDEAKRAKETPQLTPPDRLFKRGTARLMYGLPRNKPPDYEAYFRFVADEGLFQEAVDTVNALAPLPRDMLVRFTDCGQPNAFFDRKTGNITFCFELVREFDELYTKEQLTQEQVKQLIRGAVFFVFFHEVGHALVHELGVPVTGREEDAVDQFATLLLLEQGERGEQAVLSGALFFLGLSVKRAAPAKLWGEHSLDKQRFYNIACWLYGASPFRHANLVAQGLLPAERAARCGDELAQMRRSWKTIADPRLKRPLR
jgi:hypothetical protein